MRRLSARDRLEACLQKIADPDGEGARVFLKLYGDSARAAADAADARARLGLAFGPLDGRIVSIKDLFDWPGEPTLAGSKIHRDALSARTMAPAIARLARAGAVIIGKTNMTEFAFSGVGHNPHFGTPGNPADRARIPGGSSSGAAVSVADQMAEIAIGTDTGGSTRIPAALCGMVGFKPSQQRISREGAFPLSFTLDSIGPIARDVASCALADTVMAGAPLELPEAESLGALRLGVARGPLLESLDPIVGRAFEVACASLSVAGAQVRDHDVTSLIQAMQTANRTGGFAVAEAYMIHRSYYESRAADFDPFVHQRIGQGRNMSAADYVLLQRQRVELVRQMDRDLEDIDALLLPTTAIAAPKLADLAQPAAFAQANTLLLRNTSAFNFFDCCAISLPMPGSDLPTGMMLVARNGQDQRLFRIALAVEALWRR